MSLMNCIYHYQEKKAETLIKLADLIFRLIIFMKNKMAIQFLLIALPMKRKGFLKFASVGKKQ